MRIWRDAHDNLITDEQLARHIAAFGSLSRALGAGDICLVVPTDAGEDPMEDRIQWKTARTREGGAPMPPSLRSSDLGQAYQAFAGSWQARAEGDRLALLDSFAVDFAFHSGSLENEQITLHDMQEIFDHDGVSSFTGDLRTLFEMANLKAMWLWTVDTLPLGFSFTTDELLFCHETLTHGTYDQRVGSRGS